MGRFLVWFFPDSTRIEPLSVPRLSTVITKYQGGTLNSQEPTKLNQIFIGKIFPRLQFHRRIQGQRFFFHFNPLAAQLKPCQRRQAAVSILNETIKRWKRQSYTLNTRRRLLSSFGNLVWDDKQRQTKTRYQATNKESSVFHLSILFWPLTTEELIMAQFASNLEKNTQEGSDPQ